MATSTESADETPALSEPAGTGETPALLGLFTDSGLR